MAFGLNDATPAPPPGRTNLHWQNDGTGNISANIEAQRYRVPCSFIGQPGAGATVLIHTFDDAVTFPANFASTRGTVGVNFTATGVYTILKNGSAIGTVSVSTSGVFTSATSGGIAQSYAPGDRMAVTAPNPQDATGADVAFTLFGTPS